MQLCSPSLPGRTCPARGYPRERRGCCSVSVSSQQRNFRGLVFKQESEITWLVVYKYSSLRRTFGQHAGDHLLHVLLIALPSFPNTHEHPQVVWCRNTSPCWASPALPIIPSFCAVPGKPSLSFPQSLFTWPKAKQVNLFKIASYIIWTALILKKQKNAFKHLNISLDSARLLLSRQAASCMDVLLTCSAIAWWRAGDEQENVASAQASSLWGVRKPNKQWGNDIASETTNLKQQLHFLL